MNSVWIDLETTGLDPVENDILEIAVMITSPGPDYQVLTGGSWVFPYLYHAGKGLANIVVEMHEGNNLWKECRDVYYHEKESHTVEDIIAFIVANDGVGSPMFGSTTHFDRAFLKEHLPKIEELFHYRNFDISTLKAYVRDWFPEFEGKDRERHRAYPDIMDSHATLKQIQNLVHPMPVVATYEKIEDDNSIDVEIDG